GAVVLLHDLHRHLAGTETGKLGGFRDFFQLRAHVAFDHRLRHLDRVFALQSVLAEFLDLRLRCLSHDLIFLFVSWSYAALLPRSLVTSSSIYELLFGKRPS